MTLRVTDEVAPYALARFDMVIDVRSPGEYALDHVPGAVNLPVLTDAERAEVGTIYVQDSRFKARRLGAAYVARNVARHLEETLSDREGGFAPLIYCWRGGMRSNAMATIFDQVGWPTTLLTGGYRTYRRYVMTRLYEDELPHQFVLLDGHTGTAKTEMLGRLAGQGFQTLDLEGLAEHRGSLFGALSGRPQPSQKLFESRLLQALDALEPGRRVIAEAESSKIGDRMLPPALWSRLIVAPCIELSASGPDRARYLVETYSDIIANRPALEAALTRMPVQPSPERRATWAAMIEAGAFADLAQAVMALHYDPAYDRSRGRHERPLLGGVPLDPTDPTSQAAAADRVAALVRTLDAGRL